MNDKIPIFTLPLVLLPGEKLPLHIFEAKYKKMVEYCLKHNQKFGIVNSRNNDTLSIGCTAEITQITAAEGDTGEYDILVTGVERFIVKSYNYSKDYKQAYVKTWQDIDDSIDETLLKSCTRAISISWPTEYVKVTLADPKRLSDSTVSTPVSELTANSTLVTTSLSTSLGEAPGHETLTCKTGLSMSGVI